VNPIERAVRRVDRFQQHHPALGFPFAVVKKFGDDQGGNLAALVAYYGFFAVFLLLTTLLLILGIALEGNAALQRKILTSALTQFPVIGDQLRGRLGSLGGSGVALAFSVLGAVWGGLGAINAMQTALNTVWDVPFKDRPNFLFSRLRALLMLVVLGTGVVGAAVVSGVAGGTGHASLWPFRAVALLLSTGLNLGVFLLAFRILTSADVSWGDVLPGAALAGVLWTGLQTFGGFYVGHVLKGATQVYGTLAFVIALFAWIYLAAQITLMCAELNVVRCRRLWPRSITQPPLTGADREAFSSYAEAQARRPEQLVDVTFSPDAERDPMREAEGESRSDRGAG
jgi:YihY family inner membrane protein